MDGCIAGSRRGIALHARVIIYTVPLLRRIVQSVLRARVA